MARKLEKIEIECSKEGDRFVAIVKWDDGTEHATEGENYPELYANIYDLMKIKLDKEG